MSFPLRIETDVEGREIRLALVGELTYGTVALFSESLAELLDPSRSLVRVDASRLHFCDSIGLSALIGAQRQASLAGGRVVLSGVQGCLARTLSITGAGVLFGVDEPLERTEATAGTAEERA